MTDLPTGTVTFLFTDVEGSTGLVGTLGDAYGEAMSQHRRILREAVAASNGHEVDSRGEEFFAAFQRTRDAVTAALPFSESSPRTTGPATRPCACAPGSTPASRCSARAATRASTSTGSPASARPGTAARCSSRRRPGTCSRRARCPRPSSRTSVSTTSAGCPGPSGSSSCSRPSWRRSSRRCARRTAGAAAETAAAGGGKGLRVVLADDSVLLREGIARLLSDSGFDVVGQSENPDDLMLKVRSYSPGRRHRGHPHAADPDRRGSPRGAGDPRAPPRMSASSSSRSTSSPRTRWSCSPRVPKAWATS